MSRDEGGAPDSGGQGMTLLRFSAIVAASTSAVLGVLKLTGGTMSGAIAMGSQAITGLPKSTGVGTPLRFETIGTGVLPALVDWTADVATNVTETAATDTERGTIVVHTLAAAATRLSTRRRAGTSITAWYTFVSPALTDASNVVGAAHIVMGRADGVKVSFGISPSASLGAGTSFRAFRWTNKDTLAVGLGTTSPIGGPVRLGIRAAQASAGANIVLSYTLDGVTFTTYWNDTPTATFGSVGDPVNVEFGSVLQANGQVCHFLLERVVVA